MPRRRRTSLRYSGPNSMAYLQQIKFALRATAPWFGVRPGPARVMSFVGGVAGRATKHCQSDRDLFSKVAT